MGVLLVKAEEIQAGKLFSSDQQLLIPVWQRHYSWDRPQLKELWTDVRRVQEEDLNSHFLGSVVLNALPWSGMPSEARRFSVVDGQQRVTTLTLLICALRDRLAQLTDSEDHRARVTAEYTSQLLQNANLKEGHRDRLLLQEKDAAVLKPLINGTWNGSEDSRVEKAYAFFKTQISGMDKPELEGLLAIVLTRLTAVWVTLEGGDNAHRVFQSLNAGGKKLNQSDLVRNYFFLLLGQLGEAFYDSHWRQLESDLGKDIEEFLVAWTISQGYSGGKDSLFTYFHKDLLTHETDPQAVLAYGTEMSAVARLFRWIRKPADCTLGEPAKKALTDIANWSSVPAEGLILWLLRRNQDGKLVESNLVDCLEFVISFMARRQLAGMQPNLHKPIFVSAARRLRAHSEYENQDTVDYLRFLLSEGDEVRTWPNDDAIKLACRVTPIYSTARSRWAFLILERINRTLFDNPKHVPALNRGKYSVEHVMPQTLTPSWESDLKAWGVENPRQLHEGHLHVLGNLTLTPINSELSNLPFEEKREKLSDDWLRLNQDVAASTMWTEHRINERSTALAGLTCTAFARPCHATEMAELRARFGTTKTADEVFADDDTNALDDEDPSGAGEG
jgi:hypothetical protein